LGKKKDKVQFKRETLEPRKKQEEEEIDEREKNGLKWKSTETLFTTSPQRMTKKSMWGRRQHWGDGRQGKGGKKRRRIICGKRGRRVCHMGHEKTREGGTTTVAEGETLRAKSEVLKELSHSPMVKGQGTTRNMPSLEEHQKWKRERQKHGISQKGKEVGMYYFVWEKNSQRGGRNSNLVTKKRDFIRRKLQL